MRLHDEMHELLHELKIVKIENSLAKAAKY